MKKSFKQIMALTLALVMVLALAACGGSDNSNPNDGTANENTDQTDFLILGGQSSLSRGYNDNVVLNAMMENVGINITWDTMSESLAEQVNIRINGGDLPDAFMGVGFSNYDLSRYGADGTFLDLTPYITPEIMPNLYKILNEHPEIKSAITMTDGGIYGLPSGEQMTTAGIGTEESYSIFSVPQFAMINTAWLDDLGLAMPTSLDELHDVLKAFKDNDMSHKYYGNDPGTTLPMSTGFDQWCWGQNIFYAGFGFTNWANDVLDDLVLQSDGTVNFVCDDDSYRDAVTYFHDWYAEGLMDIETFSQGESQLIAKCQQGYVGVSTWWYIEELMGPYYEDYDFLPILTGPKGTQYEGTSNVTIRTGGAINAGQLSITADCKSPINLLKFFDQWFTGEAAMQFQYAPIEIYFPGKNEDGLWLSITEDESKAKYNKGAGEVKGEYEVYGPRLILANYYQDTFVMEDRAIERLEDLYYRWMKPYVKDDTVYPIDLVYTNDELDTINRYKPDFVKAVSEQEGLWIRDGGPTDAEWEAYKEHLSNSCGMDELLKVYQDAYDRYAGK